MLLATRNASKLGELRRILVPSSFSPNVLAGGVQVPNIQIVGLDVVPPFPDIPETAATFEGNALAKARGAAVATGLPTVADDSGLEVDALNGMPGVLSARWAGRHRNDTANLQLVLDQLVDVPEDRRGAAFVCAAALVVRPGVETVVRGQWHGTLTWAARGSNGFGYDPIFVPDGERRTSAELDPAEKDAASHRGQALRALLPALHQFL